MPVMLGQVLITEFMKLRRSKVPWFTLGALMAGPLGIALFMWIVREPGRAAQLGLLGAKADLADIEATWPAFASFMVLIVGTGGMLLLAFIVAYVLGREFEDGTAKNMLALPVARLWFAFAKLVVAAAWWGTLVIAAAVESFVVGFALDLPGYSAGVATGMLHDMLLAAGIAYLLVPVIAWITIWSRSVMAALGFALGMLLLGDLFGHTGWAVWFPWSIVPLLVGIVSKPVDTLPAGSYVVVALTFAAGIIGSALQLRFADNTQ